MTPVEATLPDSLTRSGLLGGRRSFQRSLSNARAGASAGGSAQRPHAAARRGGACRVEDRVDRTARRLVGALHRRQVRVGADVVGGEQQIRDPGPRLRPVGPRAGRVDEQRLRVGGARRIRERDVLVERPRAHLDAVQARVEVVAQLRPDLVADLLARAQRGDLAGVHARALPFGDVDREDAADGAVAEAREVHAAPELALGDRGQRPLGVDVDRVPALQRQVLAQVEEDPVHPARDEPVEPVQPRLGGPQLGREQGAHDLDRQRGDVEVGDHAAPAGDRDAGDLPVSQLDPLDRLPQPQLDARAAQVPGPRRQPGVAGRRVEHAVGASSGASQVHQ